MVLGSHSSCHSERKAQGFVIFSGRSTLALRLGTLQHAASCSFLDTSPVQVSAGVKAILRSQLFHVMITLLYQFLSPTCQDLEIICALGSVQDFTRPPSKTTSAPDEMNAESTILAKEWISKLKAM